MNKGLEERFLEQFPVGTIGHRHNERCEWGCTLRDDMIAFILTEREACIKKAIELFSTHEEGFGSYCDTGEDMDWSCRTECTEHGIERVKKHFKV